MKRVRLETLLREHRQEKLLYYDLRKKQTKSHSRFWRITDTLLVLQHVFNWRKRLNIQMAMRHGVQLFSETKQKWPKWTIYSYVQRYIVAHSRKHFCNWNATTCSFVVVALDVVVNNRKVFSVAMEMQQWFLFALLWSYKIFRTAVNNNEYLKLMSVCLSYSACKSYLLWVVLYYHLWPVWLYHNFPHYLINGNISRRKKKHWIQKVCFDFLYNFVWNIYHFKNNSARNYHKCT
jgi:hypothetical protein